MTIILIGVSVLSLRFQFAGKNTTNPYGIFSGETLSAMKNEERRLFSKAVCLRHNQGCHYDFKLPGKNNKYAGESNS